MHYQNIKQATGLNVEELAPIAFADLDVVAMPPDSPPPPPPTPSPSPTPSPTPPGLPGSGGGL